MSDRWATFDCYGTIADWHGGMRAALEAMVGDRAEALLTAYHEHEPVLETEKPHRLYRDVLTEGLRRASASSGIELPAGQEDALVRGWPSMPFHPDAPGGLERLRDAGWKLAVLTNCDDDLWATTAARLPVTFDLVVTAQQVGSYKPAPGHFERFREVVRPAEDGWVHVACSWFHDMQAARDLGLRRIWVDRDRTGQDPSIANAVLPDFDQLLETLERVRLEPVPSLAQR
jgi:2-haloacid dehalogenase